MTRTQAIKRAMKFANQCAIHGYAFRIYVRDGMISVTWFREGWNLSDDELRREWRWTP